MKEGCYIMNKLYTALAFLVGMLFMNSLTGEYYRYGMEVNKQIEDCEIEQGKECDIIVSPISWIAPTSFSFPSDALIGLHRQIERDPNPTKTA